MLVSDIPATATVVPSGGWTDTFSRTRYYLDPSEPALVVTRPWSDKEVADYNQVLASQSTNQGTLTTTLTSSLATLVSDIGVALSDSTLVKDSSSLNGILKATPASINADPSVFIIALARYIKRCDKAVIAAGKITTASFSDASTGQ